MAPTVAATSLSIAELRRIEELCTRYEHPEVTADRDIAGLAATANTPAERHWLLLEIIGLDVELRRDRGEQPSPSDYESVLQEDDLKVVGEVFRKLPSQSETSACRSTRYQFIDQVGRGGIGEIWRVFDKHSQRSLAIKLLRAPFRDQNAAIERLRREALLTGSLQHPGIPPIYEHGQLDNGEFYFSMKLVQGKTLEELLSSQRANAYDTIEALGWFEQVAQAIAFAHAEKLVHRDLKPHNIMIGRFGEVQMMDWGMAKRLDQMQELESPVAPHDTFDFSVSETPHAAELTSAGDIIGTPHYMAPEQARGQLEQVDARADVFGLGVILYQILLGERIDQDIDPQQIVARRAAGVLEPALARLREQGAHVELAKLCQHCLSPDPAERPRDAGVVAAAISNYLVNAQRRVTQLEIEQAKQDLQRRESRRRQRILLSAAMGIVAVALVGMFAFAWQANKTLKAAQVAEAAAISAREEAEATRRINDFLNQVLATPRPGESGSTVTLLAAINEAVPLIAVNFSDQPLLEASVRLTLGDTYRELGEPELAVEQHELALAAWLASSSKDELELLEYKSRLSGSLRKLGGEEDLLRAAALRSEVIQRRSELLGEDHPDTLDAMNGLALIHTALREYELAEALYLQLISLQAKDPATEAIDRAIPLGNLADLQLRMKKFDAAERSFKQSLALHESQPEGDYLYSVQILYGVLLDELERYQESEVMLRKGLAGRQEYLGPLHRLTLSAHRKLCRMLLAAEAYEKAEADVWACWRSHQELYGPTSSYTIGVESYLIPVMTAVGKTAELEEILVSTYQAVVAEYGADHEKAQIALERLEELRAP
ncbi:protein kinase domain-containing protein [Planctomycetaceae bacterium SH139]